MRALGDVLRALARLDRAILGDGARTTRSAEQDSVDVADDFQEAPVRRSCTLWNLCIPDAVSSRRGNSISSFGTRSRKSYPCLAHERGEIGGFTARRLERHVEHAFTLLRRERHARKE